MSFAKRLNQAMAEKEMTQTELAIAIGKGKSSVSQYLSGRSVPKLDVQKKIADELGCTIEWLNSEFSESEKTDNLQKNVSVAQAAKLLGKSEQFVRVALQNGSAPFGFATQISGNRYSYHISPKKLKEYQGEIV